MKIIILALVCISAAFAADDGIRNEFDRLLVSTSLDQMTKLNHRLLELQSEINHLQASPNKEEQDKILLEMEVMIANTEGTYRTFTQELQRTDLNLVEKYNFESALKTSETLVKNLKEFEAKVKAIKIGTDPKVTPAPHHPLHITVKDFQAMESRLMQLQDEINQLELSKSKTEQTKLVKELDETIAFMNLNLPKIQEELKRKDLSLQDRITLEMGVKIGEILVKDLKEAETKVKAVKVQ